MTSALTLSPSPSPTPSVVWITGASGALGRSVATHFAAQGARLVMLATREQGLQEVVQAWPESWRQQTLLQAVDLLDLVALAQARDQAMARWGRLDIAIHLAGGFDMGQAVHEPQFLQAFDQMVDTNVKTFLHSAQMVVPVMQAQGAGVMVNVGAASASVGKAHMGAYIAAKSALARLTESLSAELKAQGIRINAVAPSVIDSPANRASMPSANPNHWVSPDSLAQVIAFLASPAARDIHGAMIPVSGLI